MLPEAQIFFFFNLSLRKDDHTYLALRIRYRKCHQPFLSLRGSIDQSVITTGASQLNGNMILTAFKAVRFDPIANKKPMHIFLELFDLSFCSNEDISVFSFVQQVKVTQLCQTLCDSMDCSLLDSSLHGILQARILKGQSFP